MTELIIKNLSFKYKRKKPVFEDFSLTIGEGVTLLLGANGSGKSTLFKLICDVIIPQKGKIEYCIDGKPISKTKMKRAIAYIPQNFDIFPSLTVTELLTYICKTRGKSLSEEQIKEQVQGALELAHIKQYADCKMKTLSGGTKQRVGIAQSVLGDPKLIIADEPTAGLDPKQRENYHEIVREAAKSRSFLISTHLFEDTEYYDNLALIYNGKLMFQGAKDEFVNSVKKNYGKSASFKEAWIYYTDNRDDGND